MRINFNSFGLTLCGGNRAIFEVSNRLLDRGHKVSITTLGKPEHHRWFSPVKAAINYIRPDFVVDFFRKKVLLKTGAVWDYDFERALAHSVPDCDINVATYSLSAWPTIRSNKGRMFYYVQHYEPLFFDDLYDKARAELSYSLPLRKLVVSRWLQDRFKTEKETPTYVGDGVNMDIFHPREVAKRETRMVLGFIRGSEWKGDKETAQAVNAVARKLPDVEPRLVCAAQTKPFNDEELAHLYSRADVFVYASWYEGFGLPPLEAMACGSAVVATDCLGINEYAIDEYNALLVPPRDPEKLAEAIVRLLTNSSLSGRLIMGGLETAKQFSWEKVVDRVEAAFKDAL